jgi:hypothetical protein
VSAEAAAEAASEAAGSPYPPPVRAPNHHSPTASPTPCSLKALLLSCLAFIPLIVRRRPTRFTPCLPPLTLAAACFQLDQPCLLPFQFTCQFVFWCLPYLCWQPVAVDCIWVQKCALALASAALLGIPTTLADMLQHAVCDFQDRSPTPPPLDFLGGATPSTP